MDSLNVRIRVFHQFWNIFNGNYGYCLISIPCFLSGTLIGSSHNLFYYFLYLFSLCTAFYVFSIFNCASHAGLTYHFIFKFYNYIFISDILLGSYLNVPSHFYSLLFFIYILKSLFLIY